MCDTVSILSSWTGNQHESFFAKNSDREPGERQIIQAVSGESLSLNALEKTTFNNSKQGYIKTNFINLKTYLEEKRSESFKHKPLSAVISRPDWLWGAEIGVNEKGVSIGNEAVFPKLKPLKTAVLGMDILRMALHMSYTAREAKDFICDLVAKTGQAGDGGYKHRSVYHNSFLIQDKNSAYVVETAGKEWISKKVKNYCTISNTYLRKGECRETEVKYSAGIKRGLDDFKNRYESKIYNYFAKGELRNRYKNSLIAGLRGKTNMESLKSLMRSHIAKKRVTRDTGQVVNQRAYKHIKRGMGSICIHSGKLIKSETTASMIVYYIKNRFIIWYTGSSFPCVSIYKPLIVSKNCIDALNLENLSMAEKIHKKRQSLVEKLEHDYSYFLDRVKPVRDDYEKRFEKIVYSGIENKSDSELCNDIKECHRLEEEYFKIVSL